MGMKFAFVFYLHFHEKYDSGLFQFKRTSKFIFPTSLSPVTVFHLSFVSFCFYLNQLVEKFHLFKTKFRIFTYSIICSAFTWTDFIMILEENEIYYSGCVVDVCMHQFACSSILEVRFEKLPMIRNKSITQIKHSSIHPRF